MKEYINRRNPVPWFRDPDVSKYPGIDWSRPTPFIRKMLESMVADGDDMKEKFDQMEETEKPALLFAPDCIATNGKYYLYFCMQDESEGVAVSDRSEGPFTDPVMLPCDGIDPAVFIDDDGQAYYYWGELFYHGVKLHEDMVSFDREDIVDDLVGCQKEQYFIQRKPSGLEGYFSALLEKAVFCGLFHHSITFLLRGRKPGKHFSVTCSVVSSFSGSAPGAVSSVAGDAIRAAISKGFTSTSAVTSCGASGMAAGIFASVVGSGFVVALTATFSARVIFALDSGNTSGNTPGA